MSPASSAEHLAGFGPISFESEEFSRVRSERTAESLSGFFNPDSRPYRLTGYEPESIHAACGEFSTWGHDAPNGEKHWRRGRRGCGRFGCPVDLKLPTEKRWRNGWSTRQARAVTRRLGKRSNHFVVSPPRDWKRLSREYHRLVLWERAVARYTAWEAGPRTARRPRRPGPEPVSLGPSAPGPCPPPANAAELRDLREYCEVAAKLALGGRTARAGLVPHPERCVNADREGGHDGFHFHGLTDRLVRPREVASIHARTGCVVKGLGFGSTRRRALYELHHAGRYWVPGVYVRVGDQLRLISLAERADDRLSRVELEVASHALPLAGSSVSPWFIHDRARTDRLKLARARRAVEPPNPATKDNLVHPDLFVTEAVTWFGEWDTELEPDSEGILCPECGEIVPVSEWERVVWAGHGPPPSGTSGRGGEWRAVKHRREPGVDR